MSQITKKGFRYVYKCKNCEYEGVYSFIITSDDDPTDIAQAMFYDEFELYPTLLYCISIEEL